MYPPLSRLSILRFQFSGLRTRTVDRKMFPLPQTRHLRSMLPNGSPTPVFSPDIYLPFSPGPPLERVRHNDPYAGSAPGTPGSSSVSLSDLPSVLRPVPFDCDIVLPPGVEPSHSPHPKAFAAPVSNSITSPYCHPGNRMFYFFLILTDFTHLFN